MTLVSVDSSSTPWPILSWAPDHTWRYVHTHSPVNKHPLTPPWYVPLQPERLQGAEYSILSDIWSLGVSLVEMALGRYPIPQPPEAEIEAEMKQPPGGALQVRPGGNPYASHANAIRMPIFELLQIIFTSVSGAVRV